MAVETIYRVTTKRGEVKEFMDKKEADFEDARLEVMYELSDKLRAASEDKGEPVSEAMCDHLAETLMADADGLADLVKRIPKARKPRKKRQPRVVTEAGDDQASGGAPEQGEDSAAANDDQNHEAKIAL